MTTKALRDRDLRRVAPASLATGRPGITTRRVDRAEPAATAMARVCYSADWITVEDLWRRVGHPTGSDTDFYMIRDARTLQITLEVFRFAQDCDRFHVGDITAHMDDNLIFLGCVAGIDLPDALRNFRAVLTLKSEPFASAADALRFMSRKHAAPVD